MKILLSLFLIILLTTPFISAQSSSDIQIIPHPVSVEVKDGSFILNEETVISVNQGRLFDLTWEIHGMLKLIKWRNSDTVWSTGRPAKNFIRLEIDSTQSFEHNEAYRLSVSENGIIISSSTKNGLFYGIKTLRQLLPAEIEHTDPSLVPADVEWNIPAVEIYDYPRFEYRGMHLDVARHFFPVEFVKKYIDLLAMYKYNRFHWHLTEDQGWRIEIKKYPKLTEIGAWRDSTLIGNYGSGKYDGIRHGGFYTQEEIKEIVAYAKKRFITIIPEIEMPGHSSAALAAYPEYGCFDKDYQVQSTWGVFEDIYCPSEETFGFLEDVLDEVMELFPSEYIHIGGDEAPKKQWEESPIAQEVIEREGLEDEHELQSYFIGRIEKYLNEHGRQIIGWDEIMEGGLAPGATVMSWRGEAGGIESARMQHDVIMTPNATNYFDHYQADRTSEPIAIGGFTPLEDVYHYEPIPEELNEEEAQYIMGAQGNVWTEYMHTASKVEYMAFPRVIALSEVLWSPVEQRDWNSFMFRLQFSFDRLDLLNVNYARHHRR